jgi:hypothetical protein
VVDEQPLRNAFARPGGPAADLAWARTILEQRGLEQRGLRRGLKPTGPPTQVRTWNLSSLWRMPFDGGVAWLKAVPPFFAHEARLLVAMAGAPVPGVLGHEEGRMLLAEVPGKDLHGAEPPWLEDMVDLLVGLQQAWMPRANELLALGLPDWRAQPLIAAVTDVVDRTRSELALADRSALDTFVRELPARLDAVADCGLPDSLVHGDFHPGNFRGDGRKLTLLDWGDSGVGNPLLDQPAFLSAIAQGHTDAVEKHWPRRWREAVPGCDPDRAAALLAPVAAARQAVIYAKFLDNIEPSEHPYHRADPARWLHRAALLAGKGDSR